MMQVYYNALLRLPTFCTRDHFTKLEIPINEELHLGFQTVSWVLCKLFMTCCTVILVGCLLKVGYRI
jgi:hypothetical protein